MWYMRNEVKNLLLSNPFLSKFLFNLGGVFLDRFDEIGVRNEKRGGFIQLA